MMDPHTRAHMMPTSAALNRRDFVRKASLGAAGTALALGGTPSRAAADRGSRRFIETVKNARVFDLSHVWDENSPIAGVNPAFSMSLNATHAFATPAGPGTRGMFGDGGKLSFTSEIMQFSGQHGAPSIDAIGHIGRNGRLFGRVDAEEATRNPLGLGRSGVGAHLDIAHYPTSLLVNRGVLLDVARLVNGDLTPLPGEFEITGDHLKETARAQGVTLKRRDTVLIRTGWGQHFAGAPNLYKGEVSPGPSVDGARFLVKHRVVATGNDTLTFEMRPPVVTDPEFEVFPVHMLLIPDNGIFIIENFFLEELAAAQVYEFLLVVPPLKIRGGTGSALRAFALVAGRGDDDD
jgi:kynurenine formamidase